MTTGIKIMIAGLLLVSTYYGFTRGVFSNNETLDKFSQNIEMEHKSVYMILRGSNTKLGGFAKQYNSVNEYATHVAMGVYTDS